MGLTSRQRELQDAWYKDDFDCDEDNDWFLAHITSPSPAGYNFHWSEIMFKE